MDKSKTKSDSCPEISSEIEEILKALLGRSADAFWMADSRGKILYSNAALDGILGYSKNELSNLTLQRIDEHKFSDETKFHINGFIGNNADRYETNYRRKDGTSVGVEVSVGSYSLPETGTRYFAFIRDLTDSRNTEKLLHEKEEKLRILFDEFPDPVLVFKDGICIEHNRAASDTFFYSNRQLLLGCSLSDLSPAKQSDSITSLDKEKELFQQIYAEQKSRFEWMYKNREGKDIWSEVTASVIAFSGGNAICTVWRDITQQRILEEKLRENEEQFRIFSLSGQDAIVFMDNEGLVRSLNKTAEKMLGYEKEEVLGKPIYDYLAPGNFHDAQRLQLGIAAAMPSLHTPQNIEQSGRGLEFVTQKKDGEEIIVEVVLLSEIVENEWRVITVIRDITERKKTLNALKKSEEKYRRLFEETKDVVFLSTPQGRFIEINMAGVELFGYSSKEDMLAVNISTDIFNSPSDMIEFEKEMAKVGFVNFHEVFLKRKDGQKLVVSITANSVYDDLGNIAIYQGIIHDLTEVKKLEQQVLSYQKLNAVGRMIGDIAHNFNNILNIIIGSAQLAKMSGECTGTASHYLSSIENEVFRAAEIVEQLLAFGGKREMDLKTADMNIILKDFGKVLHEVLRADINVNMVYYEKPAIVKVDISRINQILLNLVLNAQDAMPGKGELSIVIFTDDVDYKRKKLYSDVRSGKYVILSITDTGIGMKPEIMKRVFEPFFTTDRTGERKGLGLSVVYGIVKQHGGFIDIKSTSGQGTTVIMGLPVIEERIKQDRPSVEGSEGRGETILVAEDEPALREIAATILKTLGYNVLQASNGLEALTVFKEKQQQIDIVLLDIAMPVMNGREAYREITKIKEGVPVLFVTGYSLDGIQTNFLQEEGFDAIQKPYTLLSLGQKIRNVLDSKTTTFKEKLT